MFLKVTLLKVVMRFGKKGKLSPHYIGPFEILEKVGNVAYHLALPPSMSGIHNIFHVSMLRKYIADSSHILQHPEIEFTPDLRQEVKPVKILDTKEKELRNTILRLVKVQ